MNNLNKINNYFKNNFQSILSNKYIPTILSLIIALYAGVIAPALPNKVINFFDTKIGKFLFIFLIAYTSNNNIKISLMLSLVFVITLCIANNKNIQNQLKKFEKFESTSMDSDIDSEADNDSINQDFENL